MICRLNRTNWSDIARGIICLLRETISVKSSPYDSIDTCLCHSYIAVLY